MFWCISGMHEGGIGHLPLLLSDTQRQYLSLSLKFSVLARLAGLKLYPLHVSTPQCKVEVSRVNYHAQLSKTWVLEMSTCTLILIASDLPTEPFTASPASFFEESFLDCS